MAATIGPGAGIFTVPVSFTVPAGPGDAGCRPCTIAFQDTAAA
ncbi:hypothetical protein ACIHEJ_14960 [Streptomyces sp. NPDC052301]